MDCKEFSASEFSAYDVPQMWHCYATKYGETALLELRIKTSKGWLVGLFNSMAALRHSLSPFVERPDVNIYSSINHLHYGLTARLQLNRLSNEYEGGVSDGDITHYAYLFLDFDPIRPKDIPATQLEHELAHRKAQEVRSYLHSLSWPDPCYADSGNGAYLLYKINLTNTIQNKEFVKDIIDRLSHRFSDESTSIDKTTFNASRIVRFLGTMNRKGAGSEERPHRVSHTIEAPNEMQEVTLAQLTELTKLLPASKANKAKKQKAASIEELVTELGRKIVHQEAYSDGMRYDLDQCIFDDAHNNPRCASLFQNSDGSRGYKCQHNGCADKTYKDVIALSPSPSSTSNEDKITELSELLSQYTIEYNTASEQIYINNERINKFTLAQFEMEGFYRRIPKETVYNMLLLEAQKRQFHPIQRIIEQLPPHEGESELARLNDVFATDHPDIRYRGRVISYIQLFIEYWMVGAIRKAFTGEFNPMLVLIGSEGIGKSSLAEFLAMPFQGYFTQDVACQLANKDAAISQSDVFIWEIGEVDRVTTNHAMSDLKNFLTLSTYKQRRPYERLATELRSIANFIGTSNKKDLPFLKDTEGRRFHIVTLNNPFQDKKALQLRDGTLSAERMWAEAYNLYLQGWYEERTFALVDTDKEKNIPLAQLSTQAMQPYIEAHVGADVIERYFDIDSSREEWKTATFDIVELFRQHGVGTNRYHTAKDVASLMKTLGLKQVRIGRDKQRGYAGIRLKLTPPTS